MPTPPPRPPKPNPQPPTQRGGQPTHLSRIGGFPPQKATTCVHLEVPTGILSQLKTRTRPGTTICNPHAQLCGPKCRGEVKYVLQCFLHCSIFTTFLDMPNTQCLRQCVCVCVCVYRPLPRGCVAVEVEVAYRGDLRAPAQLCWSIPAQRVTQAAPASGRLIAFGRGCHRGRSLSKWLGRDGNPPPPLRPLGALGPAVPEGRLISSCAVQAPWAPLQRVATAAVS